MKEYYIGSVTVYDKRDEYKIKTNKNVYAWEFYPPRATVDSDNS